MLEFILLSDIFGLFLLLDAIDPPKLPALTEATVLEPFHRLSKSLREASV